MYTETIQALGDQAAAKLAGQRRSLVSHIVRSMLAGMYVGAAIVLIFTIGGSLAQSSPSVVKLVMGVCFGGALTMVIFAGSELFTGSNLILTLGVLTRKAKLADLGTNWLWTWIGNLAGSALLAGVVIRAGIFDGDKMEGVRTFVLNLVQTKMTLAPEQLFWRAVLANWLVCLGVWMAGRAKEDAARILLIWWCMFTFITCGYEHSVANMCGLLLGLFLPHGSFPGITWEGYAYNLGLATFGNIVGGAVFVAGMYWLASPKAREAVAPASDSESANGVLEPAALSRA